MAFPGDTSIERIFTFIAIMIIALVVANLTQLLLRRHLEKRTTRRNAKSVSRFVQYTILFAGIASAISIFGVDLSTIGASLGILGVAVAFSSQQIIQNVFAGILISVQKLVRLEDWVEIGGTGICHVKDISLTRTTLRDAGGRIISIPNSAMLTQNVINYTRSDFFQTNVTVTFHNEHFSLEKIQSIALKIGDDHPLILPNMVEQKTNIQLKDLLKLARKNPIKFAQFRWLYEDDIDMKRFEPTVNIIDVTQSNVKVIIRFWINDITKIDAIKSEFLVALIDAMKKEKMKFA